MAEILCDKCKNTLCWYRQTGGRTQCDHFAQFNAPRKPTNIGAQDDCEV